MIERSERLTLLVFSKINNRAFPPDIKEETFSLCLRLASFSLFACNFCSFVCMCSGLLNKLN